MSVVASPGALPRSRANRRSARRHLALLRAFARQGLHVKLAYRSAFWVNLLNAVIKVVAAVALGIWRGGLRRYQSTGS